MYAETVEGTPQGAGISPLLANIFLHYALDLWVRQWMRRAATGPTRPTGSQIRGAPGPIWWRFASL